MTTGIIRNDDRESEVIAEGMVEPLTTFDGEVYVIKDGFNSISGMLREGGEQLQCGWEGTATGNFGEGEIFGSRTLGGNSG